MADPFGMWPASQGIADKMRIAQVAPLYESCPPQLYGGTERVVCKRSDRSTGVSS